MLEAAAPAVAAMWPEQAGTYCCPLCGEFFTEDQIEALSEDHAPPGSLRGRRRLVVLTCERCNKRAGASVDVAMRDHEELRDARLHRMTQPRDAIFQIGETRARIEAQFGPGDTVSLFGVPKANRKETHDALVRKIAQISAGTSCRIAFPVRHPRHRDEIGWLRSAYLIAFASGGYRYAFAPALDGVRAQLDPKNLDRVVIDKFAWRIQGAQRSHAAIRYIHEPEAFRSIAVQMGDVLVLLPVLGDTKLYSRLADESIDLRTANLRYLPVPWPVPPTYGMGSAEQE
jgi:hypothetical protein